MGVTSHVYADIMWHFGSRMVGLADYQSFLYSMCHNGSICKDFYMEPGAFPTCHQTGDIGGAIYLGERYVADGIYEGSWSFPTWDIQRVYETMGIYNQTAFVMNICTAGMYDAFVLEKIFVDWIPTDFDYRASFLTEEPDLWFNGGFEDMATQVAWKMEYISKMMSHPGLTAAHG